MIQLCSVGAAHLRDLPHGLSMFYRELRDWWLVQKYLDDHRRKNGRSHYRTHGRATVFRRIIRAHLIPVIVIDDASTDERGKHLCFASVVSET